MPLMGLEPFRDAASIHVDATPERVADLLRSPSVLKALDHRLPADQPLDIVQHDGRIEVRDLEGHVHLAFRLREENHGTRLAALETVRPTTPLEATKHVLFPGHQHKELQVEMGRLKDLLETLGPG